MAKKAGTTPEIIIDYLQRLENSGVIKYVKKRKTPFIVFISERLDDKNIFISKEHFQERKQRYIKRAHAVLNYAESTTKCRSQILLSYFGETDAYRCGNCDVCKKRNQLELSTYEFDLINEQIKKHIIEKPLPVDDLVDKIGLNPEKVIKVIQWLVDNDKIEYTIDNRLIRIMR